MIHPVIDDALKVSTVISNNFCAPIRQHLPLQVRPHHTWPEVHQMVDNLFANSYMRLPGYTTGNIDQDINYIRGQKGGKGGKKGKGRGKKAKGKGSTTQLQLQPLQQLLQRPTTTIAKGRE